MSTCTTFYQILAEFVTARCPELTKWSRARLVWFIFGIVVAQSVVLCRIAQRQVSVLPHSKKVASEERRLRRLANDPTLDWNRAYKRAVQAVLAKATQAKTLVVVVDETAQAEHLRLLSAALWYRGRAIPLAWHLRPAQQGEFWEAVRQVLAQTQQVLPAQVPVLVVADRGFGTPAFTDMVASLGWNWLVRLQGQTLFQSQFCPAQAVKGLLNCAGQRCKKWGKLFKKQGWRTGSVVAIWHKPYREPLVLGSNLPPDYSMLRYYKYRFAIESMFRDCKSLGFQWEGSQVRVLEHCQKVVLGLCWGVLIAVVLGEQVAQEEMGLSSGRAGYSRPDSAKFSLVYKGLERVQSYVVGKVQKPIEWELSYYEAERWSKQCHQQFALRYLATSQPSPQLKAA